jgi:hypothetical protein
VIVLVMEAAGCVGALLFVIWFIGICRDFGPPRNSGTRAEIARQNDAHRTIDGLYDRAEQQVRSVVEQHRRER